MKIAQAVFHSLMGDGIVTGRDEKGLFVAFDRVTLTMRDRHAVLWCGKTKVGEVAMLREFRDPSDIFTLTGIEGRYRLDFTE